MPQDFLVEIGTQELPPTSLEDLSINFERLIRDQLVAHNLGFKTTKRFASPRRLAVLVEHLDNQTPEQAIVVWGPPKKVAVDSHGKFSKAALAFATKNSISPDNLTFENDGKADKLIHRSVKKGEDVIYLLGPLVQQALDRLPIAIRMRWGINRAEFVRPIQWIVLMFGPDIIQSSIFGLQANNLTRGHRFHCNTTLEISSPGNYESLLENSAHVIPDFYKRRDIIRQQVLLQAEAVGGKAIIGDDLLNEVTGLVEWPVALRGSFDPKFLDVPSEALVYSMKEHQKYFHVLDQKDQLMPYFITVSNIDSIEPAQVIKGNERVIRPRLSDAAFFYEVDKQITLADRSTQLSSIVFQNKLGSLFDKSQRIASLAGKIASTIGSNTVFAQRAGQLCKADLLSNMVLEFDKMQGIAGYYYAINDGEENEIAVAIKDHYLPKFSGDILPLSLTGSAVALADRLDTIVGIFSIGQKPTGSKDPFALRRASLGVLRIIIEKKLNLDLKQLLTLAASNYGPIVNNIELAVKDTFDYMIERFRAQYEEQNIAAEIFLSVAIKNISSPLDIEQRVKAVHNFSQLPEASALAAANKRVANLLAKVDRKLTNTIDLSLLVEPAEIELAKSVKKLSTIVTPLFASHDYMQALAALAGLRDPVDKFFEDVMVMVDNKQLQNNRLALLQQLRALFFEVADISLLASTK